MSEDRPGAGVPAEGLSEEQVARLLEAAGPVGPTPAEVVSRLDAVLADLVAERSADGVADSAADGVADADQAADAGADAVPASPAVSLDAARARRRAWGPRVLAAAAVLGVAGVGLSVVDDLTGGSGSESASAGDAAGAQSESSEAGGSSESGAGSDRGQARRGSGGSGEAGASDDVDALDQPERASESARAPQVPRLLRIADDADLRAAVRGTAGGDVAALSDLGYLAGSGSSDAGNRAGSGGCVTPGGPGRRTLVSYQGDPATLVVRRTGDRLDGRVYDCDLGLQLDGVEIGPARE